LKMMRSQEPIPFRFVHCNGLTVFTNWQTIKKTCRTKRHRQLQISGNICGFISPKIGGIC
jgi:hypothetical protein